MSYQKWNPKSDLISREKERKKHKERMFVCAFRLPRKFKSENDLNSDFQVHLRYTTDKSGAWIFFNQTRFWKIFDHLPVKKAVIAQGLVFIGLSFFIPFWSVWTKCLLGKEVFIFFWKAYSQHWLLD